MSKRFSKARAMGCGALALLFARCGLDGVDGNGQRVNEVRALEGFSSVDSEGSLDAQITRADAFHVEVSIDSNLLRAVRTQVVGDVLSIDVVEPIGDTVAGPHVIVTMPVLHRASLGGSGSVSAHGFQQADPVSLALDGSGQLSFAGGDIDLYGAASLDSVTVSGSGSIRRH